MVDIPAMAETEISVFCQISGREISPESCSYTQGQTECFGCASVVRRCEKCHENFVTVSATGTCSHCTILEIGNERKSTVPEVATRVSCQLMKREIAGSMCRTMQGQEGCRRCAATSRLCESCGKHPVRFPEYGLCFTCAVSELGDGWTAEVADKSIQTHVHEPIDEPEIQESEWWNEKKPSEPTAGSVVLPRKTNFQNRTNHGRKLPDGALERTRELVIRTQNASYQFIMDQIGVNTKGAQSILKKLETEGVVSRARGRSGRAVLIKSEDRKSPQSEEEKVFEPDVLRKVLTVVARLMIRGANPRVSVKDIAAIFTAQYALEYGKDITVEHMVFLLKKMEIKTYASNGTYVLASGQYARVRTLCVAQKIFSNDEEVGLRSLPEEIPASPLSDTERKLFFAQSNTPDATKLKTLRELIKAVGEYSDVGRTLDEILTDLEKWQQVRAVLKTLLK